MHLEVLTNCVLDDFVIVSARGSGENLRRAKDLRIEVDSCLLARECHAVIVPSAPFFCLSLYDMPPGTRVPSPLQVFDHLNGAGKWLVPKAHVDLVYTGIVGIIPRVQIGDAVLARPVDALELE